MKIGCNILHNRYRITFTPDQYFNAWGIYDELNTFIDIIVIKIVFACSRKAIVIQEKVKWCTYTVSMEIHSAFSIESGQNYCYYFIINRGYYMVAQIQNFSSSEIFKTSREISYLQAAM